MSTAMVLAITTTIATMVTVTMGATTQATTVDIIPGTTAVIMGTMAITVVITVAVIMN